jgi:phosphoenolpyruvate carboxykinase (GTP)
MASYFAHWLSIGARSAPEKLPRIYLVNWFRKDAEGRFIWPGFGENSRVLKWIVDRIENRGDAAATAIGLVPTPGGLDIDGLALTAEQHYTLLNVDAEAWRTEVAGIAEYYEQFGDSMPPELLGEVARLETAVSVQAGSR